MAAAGRPGRQPSFEPRARCVRCTLMAICIRPFQEADRGVVRDLTVAAFDGVSIDQNIDRVLGPVASRDWRYRKGRHIDHDIDVFGATLVVAQDVSSGAVVGYITMQCDEETKIGWIHNLAVAREARGQGLGRRLIEHALAFFRAAGMTIAKIETLEAERDRPRALSLGRLCGSCPPDSLRDGTRGSNNAWIRFRLCLKQAHAGPAGSRCGTSPRASGGVRACGRVVWSRRGRSGPRSAARMGRARARS